MKKENKTKKGFSLIEVLIALMILSVGVVAISALMAGSIKNSVNAKNQIIASGLAQEAIEMVRNLKDSGVFDPAAGTYNDRRIDAAVFTVENVLDKKLYLNGGFYTHNPAGRPTKFLRSISYVVTGSVLPAPSTREIKVTTKVSWNGSNIPAICNLANKCVSVVSVLQDVN